MDDAKLAAAVEPASFLRLFPHRRRGWGGWIFPGLVAATILLGRFQISGAQSVTLAWNSNSETNLAGYRLYYGQASRSYSGIVPVGKHETSATVTNLEAGLTYYFAVTAYTGDGLESDYSDEVRYTVPGSGNLEPELTESLVIPGEETDELLPFPADTEEVVEIGGDEAVKVEPDVVIDVSSDRAPRLEIMPIGQPPVAYFVWFEAPANRQCELQVSDDLVEWHLLFPFTTGGAGRLFEFTELATGNARRYYRLKIE
jgi:hypothetical protein